MYKKPVDFYSKKFMIFHGFVAFFYKIRIFMNLKMFFPKFMSRPVESCRHCRHILVYSAQNLSKLHFSSIAVPLKNKDFIPPRKRTRLYVFPLPRIAKKTFYLSHKFQKSRSSNGFNGENEFLQQTSKSFISPRTICTFANIVERVDCKWKQNDRICEGDVEKRKLKRNSVCHITYDGVTCDKDEYCLLEKKKKKRN